MATVRVLPHLARGTILWRLSSSGEIDSMSVASGGKVAEGNRGQVVAIRAEKRDFLGLDDTPLDQHAFDARILGHRLGAHLCGALVVDDSLTDQKFKQLAVVRHNVVPPRRG
jgi:hypothetical protein